MFLSLSRLSFALEHSLKLIREIMSQKYGIEKRLEWARKNAIA